MVVLQDLFKLLAAGEFSNMFLSRADTGNLAESEYEKVINHVNLGILEIYKRFKFLENELTLHVDPAVTKYYLRLDRVVAEHNISLKTYIEQPCDNEGCLNIIEVTAIYDEDGNELVLNNRFKTPSIIQVANDILKITNIGVAQKFNIVYQAYPNKIIIDDEFDPAEYIIPIPETIIEPLLYYTAARVYKPIGANDSTANADKSAGYEQQYELACQKIDLYGLDTQKNDTPDTFAQRGWA